MEEEIVTRIMEAIKNESFSLNESTYFIIAIISFFMAGLGVFISSYIKEKGKNYATKEDFQELLNQTKRTTKETESIKLEISKHGWLESKQWELRFKVYSEILQSLSEWRVAIKQVMESMFKADGSYVDEWTDEHEGKTKKIGLAVSSAWSNIARIESIAEMVLSSEKAERIRNLKTEATQDAMGIGGRAAFESVITKIIELEKEISREAKKILFDNN